VSSNLAAPTFVAQRNRWRRRSRRSRRRRPCRPFGPRVDQTTRGGQGPRPDVGILPRPTTIACSAALGDNDAGQQSTDSRACDRAETLTAPATCPVSDGGACMCSRDPVPFERLTIPWDCFCATFGCDRQWVTPTQPSCQNEVRVDYPECGLTALVGSGSGLVTPVFDTSRELVGLTAISDTAAYSCPSDPLVTANMIRGGRYPDMSCRAVACQRCYDEPFPCPPDNVPAR
jgi:hypothetical protein